MDAPPPSPPMEAVDVLATPAVHRMASEFNVDLNEVMNRPTLLEFLNFSLTHSGAANW